MARPPTSIGWSTSRIAPHVPVIDKSQREDGTFSRDDFIYDEVQDIYATCPAGKTLTTTGHVSPDHSLQYLGSVPQWSCLPAQGEVLPKNASARRVKRDVHEAARDVARTLAKTLAFAQSRRDRKKVEMLFAHLKRILRLDRLRLRGPEWSTVRVHAGGNRKQNLRRLAKAQ